MLEQLKSFLYVPWPPWFPHLCSLSKTGAERQGRWWIASGRTRFPISIAVLLWNLDFFRLLSSVSCAPFLSYRIFPLKGQMTFFSLIHWLCLSSCPLCFCNTHNHPLLSKSSLRSQSFTPVLPGFSCCVPFSGCSSFLWRYPQSLVPFAFAWMPFSSVWPVNLQNHRQSGLTWLNLGQGRLQGEKKQARTVGHTHLVGLHEFYEEA